VTDYIIGFRPSVPFAQRASTVGRAGAQVRFDLHMVNAMAVSVPNLNALAALQRETTVVSIRPDLPVYATAKPGGSGPGGAGQVVPEGIKRVGLPRLGSDGEGITIAVLDTGVDASHTDLSVLPQRFDAYGGTCSDLEGHGTHVAGIIGALDNATGVLGVAPKAKIACGKVLDDQGSGSDSSIILGLQWVVENRQVITPPIRVVNMSLGRDKVAGDMELTGTTRGAIKQLYDARVTVVVAAGNESGKEVAQEIPAGLPEVIAVASVTAKTGSNSCKRLGSAITSDTASFFTTDGSYAPTLDGMIGVTISAPGEDQEDVSRACLISSLGILSLKPGGGTQRLSGTSMSSPHVAGVVARLYQTGLAGTPETARSWLRANATDKGVKPGDLPTTSYTFDGEREGIANGP
jgi:subtilisin